MPLIPKTPVKEVEDAAKAILQGTGNPAFNFTREDWLAALDRHGINLDYLAEMYYSALNDAKAATKLKEIVSLLSTMGIGKSESQNNGSIQINIVSGDKTAVHAMLAPQRVIKPLEELEAAHKNLDLVG